MHATAPHPDAAVNPVGTRLSTARVAVMAAALVLGVVPRGVRAEEPAPPPAVPAPVTDTPPVEDVPADAPPAPTEGEAPASASTTEDPAADPPASESPSSPPLVEPSAPLQRWLRDRSSRVDDAPAAPAVTPATAELPPAGAPGARARVTLKLRDGRSVEGEVVSESAEGWALKLPTGETRFFDRLDVVADNAPSKSRPGWTQKAVLLASLAWPGAGQVIYGAMVQHGQVWERSALVVGTILSAVAIASGVVVVAGVILGFALASQGQAPAAGLELAGPLNPITFAGILGMVLAFSVGVLDAGARAILD